MPRLMSVLFLFLSSFCISSAALSYLVVAFSFLLFVIITQFSPLSDHIHPGTTGPIFPPVLSSSLFLFFITLHHPLFINRPRYLHTWLIFAYIQIRI